MKQMPILKQIVFSFLFFLSVFFGYTQSSGYFKICTFNIQNFGKAKLNDSTRVNELATIIRKYDIVAVQEVSDVSGTLSSTFMEIVNQKGRKSYQVACSERTGRQPDDRSSQEQYAFYYDTTLFTLIGLPKLYPDTLFDFFAREPFVTTFKTKSGDFCFTLVTVHTAPAEAVKEIGHLDDVANWVATRDESNGNIIILGDFNASCTYAKPNQLDQLRIRDSSYFWVVPDNAKTNLSAKSDCAYDRIVITRPVKEHFTGRWGIDACFTSKSVSDHWPVWAEFKIKPLLSSSFIMSD